MSTFTSGNILLPKTADMKKWAVVACDQYTSEPEYWNETAKLTEDAPSALNLILPELYLEDDDVEQRIRKIHSVMNNYITDGIFEEYKDSMIYIERTQFDGAVRAGIVGCIDLEAYDYRKGSDSPVRATEATVIERIPPRIKVRKSAALELPHIMILVDDAEKTVIEPLEAIKDKLEKVYDFELMQKGGSIKGWLLGKNEQSGIEAALSELSSQKNFDAKYGLSGKKPLVFAMGDGNHSLATAKEFYEELKRANPGVDMSNHPARYALVEIVNLHSPALEFEAIHRIVTGVDVYKLMSELTARLALTSEKTECGQSFSCVFGGKHVEANVSAPLSKLTVGSLQQFLDEYIAENGGKIDYIHGAEVVEKLSEKEGSIGFILPDMKKSELFPTVICDGALPRKTFSMGHAWDKRYYVECRKITL